MNVTNRSISPDGRYQVTTAAWEARMSLWIEMPWITDLRENKRVLSFNSSHWSLDEARWLGDTTVELVMRKYPGNHKPPDLKVTVDFATSTARVGEREVPSLQDLERVMDAALDYY